MSTQNPAEVPQDLAQFFGALRYGQNEVQPAIDLTRAKTFTGDGTEFLFAPGLRNIDFITVDGVTLDAYRDDEVIDPANSSQTKTIRIPFYMLLSHNGQEVIIRSQVSNFGRWQKGSPITVVGDWSDAPLEAEAPQDPPAPPSPIVPGA